MAVYSLVVLQPKKYTMDNKDIQAMFQVCAELRPCKENDPKRLQLATIANSLTRQYIDEYLSILPNESQGTNIGLQEAFAIIVKACQSATSLELEHHPDGITDEQVQTLAAVRKMALDRIVEEISTKS